MERLNRQTMAGLEKLASLPKYDLTDARAGILHLGVGAFHRAHQAWYTEALLNAGESGWRIRGASLRSATVRDQLAPQDGLYTLAERGPEGDCYQVIGALTDVMVAPESPEALLVAMSDPAIAIVSITVTEKGYCHDPATGNLNLEHPDIQHDLAHPEAPVTAIGYLVHALDRRRRAGADSFTAMSCDNLPENGRILERVVGQFARALSAELADWIGAHTAFPCTMIDRIVPATTDEDRDALASALGVRDEAMVGAEPFSQWVIEDSFSGPRPAWEDAGALLVDDVHVYEIMKLRLLNGSHSLLAYAGYLAGCETMSEVMREPALVRLCQQFMDREVTPSLECPPGFDMEAYKRELRERFANPALKHRTWQIAMDGSQKIPQRWLQTLAYQIDNDGPIDGLCLALAAWMRYVSAVDLAGNAIDVQDPKAAEFKALWQKHSDQPVALVDALLGIRDIFPETLATNTRLREGVVHSLKRIEADGVLASIEVSVLYGKFT